MWLELKKKLLLLTVILLLGVSGTLGSVGADSDPAAVEAAKEQLSKASAAEQAVIRKLLALSSKIEEIDGQILKLNEDMAVLNTQMAEKNSQLENEGRNYTRTKESLAQVLRAQQRAGAASRIEVILGAENLKDLLHRINLLRDLSRNTSKLMRAIETLRSRLDLEKAALEEMAKTLAEQKKSLKGAQESQKAARLELERYLDSLKADKATYTAYLQTLETLWSSLKPVLTDTINSFNEIIRTGGLPADTVQMTGTLFNAKGRIEEKKFNQVLSKRKDLPEMRFGLFQERVTLTFPKYQTVLEGRFVLLDPQTIQYRVEKGTFYNMPLGAKALEELFSDGDLVFKLKTMIGKNTIKRIDHHNGYIELLIAGSKP